MNRKNFSPSKYKLLIQFWKESCHQKLIWPKPRAIRWQFLHTKANNNLNYFGRMMSKIHPKGKRKTTPDLLQRC